MRQGWFGIGAVIGVSLRREAHVSGREQVQLFVFTNISQGGSFRKKKTYVRRGHSVREPAWVPQEKWVLPDPFFLKKKREERRKAGKVMSVCQVSFERTFKGR